MRNALIHKIIGLLSMVVIASCSGNPFFVQTRNIPSEGWNAADTIVMPIDCHAPQLSAENFDHPHNINVGIRTTSEYRYENLSLLIELTRDGHTIRRQRYNIQTAPHQGYERNGHAFINHPALTLPDVTLSPLHRYSIRVTHLMRLNPLPGLSDLRVEVE